jgi:DNA-binding GntR family transcriptional regulator
MACESMTKARATSRRTAAKSAAPRTTRKTAPARMNAAAIADEVGRMIEDRELRPGEHLREQDLANRFAVSRGPVREALKILSSRFQVEFRPNIGVTVPQLHPEEIMEIHELRGEILRICAKWATQRATNDELDELIAIARGLPKIAQSGDVETFLSTTFLWRHKVVEASHSRRLIHAFSIQGFGSVSLAWLSRTDADATRRMIERADDWVECSLALKARDHKKAQSMIATAYDRDLQYLEHAFARLTHIR